MVLLRIPSACRKRDWYRSDRLEPWPHHSVERRGSEASEAVRAAMLRIQFPETLAGADLEHFQSTRHGNLSEAISEVAVFAGNSIPNHSRGGPVAC